MRSFGFQLLLVLLIAALLLPERASAQTAGEDTRVATEAETAAARLLVRGMTRAFLEDDATALEMYLEALRYQPDDPAIQAGLAQLLRRQGDYSQAAFYAERAFALLPDNAETARAAAELRGLNGDADGAIAAWEVVSRLMPHDAEANLLRARLLRDKGDLRASRSAFEMADAALDARAAVQTVGAVMESRDEMQRTTLSELLDVMLDLQDFEEALPVSRRLAEASGGASARLQEARILVALNREPEAILVYQTILGEDPGNEDAVRELGQLGAGAAAGPGGGNATEAVADSEMSAEDVLRLVRDAESDLRNVSLRLRALDVTLARMDLDNARRLVEDGLLFFPGNYALLERAIDVYLHSLLPEHVLELISEIDGADAPEPASAYAAAAAEWILSGTEMSGESTGSTRHDYWAALAGLSPAAGAQLRPETAVRTSPLIRIVSALVSARNGQRNEGIEKLSGGAVQESVMALSPLELMVLGDLLAQEGRRGEAVDAWNRALEMAPANPILLGRLQ